MLEPIYCFRAAQFVLCTIFHCSVSFILKVSIPGWFQLVECICVCNVFLFSYGWFAMVYPCLLLHCIKKSQLWLEPMTRVENHP